MHASLISEFDSKDKNLPLKFEGKQLLPVQIFLSKTPVFLVVTPIGLAEVNQIFYFLAKN